jgi:hypothetical protein
LRIRAEGKGAIAIKTERHSEPFAAIIKDDGDGNLAGTLLGGRELDRPALDISKMLDIIVNTTDPETKVDLQRGAAYASATYGALMFAVSTDKMSTDKKISGFVAISSANRGMWFDIDDAGAVRYVGTINLEAKPGTNLEAKPADERAASSPPRP